MFGTGRIFGVRFQPRLSLFATTRTSFRERAPWAVEGSFKILLCVCLLFTFDRFHHQLELKKTNSMFLSFVYFYFLIFSLLCCLSVGKVPRKRVKFFDDSFLHSHIFFPHLISFTRHHRGFALIVVRSRFCVQSATVNLFIKSSQSQKKGTREAREREMRVKMN